MQTGPQGVQSQSTSSAQFSEGYNERLFEAGGLRSFYHLARFRWVAEQVRRLGLSNLKLVELGCFDGRLFSDVEPAVSEYVGLDANHEGGLDLARAKYSGRSDVTLIETSVPEPLRQFPDGYFTAAAALETLEHIPPAMVGDYLDELARVTRGYFFVTVPNEMGPVFLLKYLAKQALYGDARHYSFKELVAASVRRSDLVERDNHKGFDYRKLLQEVAERFKIERVEGIPPLHLPAALSPTVAILASSRMSG